MSVPGVRFGAAIAAAAAVHHLDPGLLAAVAAQETGGPGANSGNNIVGDGGHGRGVFQIDDRSWAFARTSAAMDPAQKADMAASILQDNLQRYGGNVKAALSAYNSGSPDAAGTLTTWGDGATLGYADSVMRHYAALGGDAAQLVADDREMASKVNALGALGAQQSPGASSVPAEPSSAAAMPVPAMPPLVAQPLPPAPPVPQGLEAQSASSVGSQADHDMAGLIDQGDVYDSAGDA